MQSTIRDHQHFIFALQHLSRTAQKRNMNVRELLNTPLMRLGGGIRLFHEPESRHVLSAMEPRTTRRGVRRIRFNAKKQAHYSTLCKKKRRSSPRHPTRKRKRCVPTDPEQTN